MGKPHRKKPPTPKKKLLMTSQRSIMTSQKLKKARKKNSEVATTNHRQLKRKKFKKKLRRKLQQIKKLETPLAAPEPPADASPEKMTDPWYYELQYWEIPLIMLECSQLICKYICTHITCEK